VKKITVALLLTWQMLHADTAKIRVVNAASFSKTRVWLLEASFPFWIESDEYDGGGHRSGSPANHPGRGNREDRQRGSAAVLCLAEQVNSRIDPAIPTGAATLTLTSPTGTFTKNIVLGPSTPGIFQRAAAVRAMAPSRTQ